MGKGVPEWWRNRLDASSSKSLLELFVGVALDKFLQHADRFVLCPLQVFFMVLSLLWFHLAHWAPVLHTARHQTLLRIICHVCHQNWKHMAPIPIGACCKYPGFSCFLHRLKQNQHCIVEGSVAGKQAGFVGKAIKFPDWYVTDEDCGMGRWFPPYVL